MRGMLGISFVGGAVNSVHKQNNLETKIPEAALTNRGLQNLQKGFFALLATSATFFSGVLMVMIANSMNPYRYSTMQFVLNLTGVSATFPVSFITSVYGIFKSGEGVMDLYQSPPASLRR